MLLYIFFEKLNTINLSSCFTQMLAEIIHEGQSKSSQTYAMKFILVLSGEFLTGLQIIYIHKLYIHLNSHMIFMIISRENMASFHNFNFSFF